MCGLGRVKHATLQAQFHVLSHPIASAVGIQVPLGQNDSVDAKTHPCSEQVS